MAVRFDAAADRLVRTSDVLNHNSPYTFMEWVYLTSAAAGTFPTLFCDGTDDVNDYDVDQCYVRATSMVWRAYVDLGGASTYVSSSIPATVGRWYHIALVRASATSLALYVNGQAPVVNTRNITGRTTATRLEIGGDTSSDLNPLDGRVAAVKIWTTALTPAEIWQEMQCADPVTRLGQIYGGYRTPPGLGNRSRDYSGRGRHWTEVGTLTDEAPPWIDPRPRHLPIIQVRSQNTYAQTLTLSMTSALQNGTVGTFNLSTPLAATLGLSDAAAWNANASATLAVTAGLGAGSAGTFNVTGSLEAILEFTASGLLAALASLALGVTPGLSDASVGDFNISATLTVTPALTDVAVWEANASATIAATVGAASGGLIDAAGTITLDAIVAALTSALQEAQGSVTLPVTPEVGHGVVGTFNVTSPLGLTLDLVKAASWETNATVVVAVTPGATPSGLLGAGGSVTLDAVLAELASALLSASASVGLPVTVTFVDTAGNTWEGTFTLPASLDLSNGVIGTFNVGAALAVTPGLTDTATWNAQVQTALDLVLGLSETAVWDAQASATLAATLGISDSAVGVFNVGESIGVLLDLTQGAAWNANVHATLAAALGLSPSGILVFATPSARILVVRSETRTLTVPAEERVDQVSSSD